MIRPLIPPCLQELHVPLPVLYPVDYESSIGEKRKAACSLPVIPQEATVESNITEDPAPSEPNRCRPLVQPQVCAIREAGDRTAPLLLFGMPAADHAEATGRDRSASEEADDGGGSVGREELKPVRMATVFNYRPFPMNYAATPATSVLPRSCSSAPLCKGSLPSPVSTVFRWRRNPKQKPEHCWNRFRNQTQMPTVRLNQGRIREGVS